jgi:hypothetical protein
MAAATLEDLAAKLGLWATKPPLRGRPPLPTPGN